MACKNAALNGQNREEETEQRIESLEAVSVEDKRGMTENTDIVVVSEENKEAKRGWVHEQDISEKTEEGAAQRTVDTEQKSKEETAQQTTQTSCSTSQQITQTSVIISTPLCTDSSPASSSSLSSSSPAALTTSVRQKESKHEDNTHEEKDVKAEKAIESMYACGGDIASVDANTFGQIAKALIREMTCGERVVECVGEEIEKTETTEKTQTKEHTATEKTEKEERERPRMEVRENAPLVDQHHIEVSNDYVINLFIIDNVIIIIITTSLCPILV